MAVKSRKAKDSYLGLIQEFPLRKIRDAESHRQALAIFARFAGRPHIDEGAADYLAVLVDLIAEYEKGAGHAVDTTNVTPAEVVRHLMTEAGLSITRLAADIGVGQSNLSEMLGGKREWSKAAIRGLSLRFALNPMLFLA